MRQYRYILFKDGKPWKGLFDELDFMNEYDHSFRDLLQEAQDRWPTEIAEEQAIIKFFRTIQPAIFDSRIKGYRSLLKEYILGANEDEGSIVYGIDWADLDFKERSLFKYFCDEFEDLLNGLNEIKQFDTPVFGVTRGTGALSKL